jgi:hypothetical protein
LIKKYGLTLGLFPPPPPAVPELGGVMAPAPPKRNGPVRNKQKVGSHTNIENRHTF